MASAAQIDANRANALKSTGPRSPEGKAATARNALRHGLRGRDVVLRDIESPDEFMELRASFIQRFAPVDSFELSLVHRIATAEWRIRRIHRIEAATIEESLVDSGIDNVVNHSEYPSDPEDYKEESHALSYAVSDAGLELDRLYRFETQLERSIDRSIRQIERLRRSPAFCTNKANPAGLPAEPAPLSELAAEGGSNSSEQSQSVAAGAAETTPSGLTAVRPICPAPESSVEFRLPAATGTSGPDSGA
ncbi:MAG: hypothetical protein ACKV22_29940 [Bryobacteraceae bacterium]